MRKKAKKENWLYSFYKENVMYIWVVLGIIVVSGFSIGMSIGKLSQNSTMVLDSNKLPNNTIVDNGQVAMNNTNLPKNNNKESDKVIDYEEIIPIDGGKKITAREQIDKEKNMSNQSKNNNKETNIAQASSTNIVKDNVKVEKKLEFIMPIEGEILRDFTTDTLVFSNTLQEWVSHEGIDIQADLASPVKAIEDGNVVEIKNDPRFGYIIVLDHGKGYKSVYCNLSTIDMVHIGKKVDKGQVISGIGNTALFEIKDNPHLHFEFIKDGKIVNPKDYIK